MATHQPDEKLVGRSEVKNYIFTPTTFIKREIPLCERGMDMNGNPIVLPRLEERFRNEAAALELIRTNTTIPVPKLISWGKDEKGLLYLETELVQGSVRCDMAGDECRMPTVHHTTRECNMCKDIARGNANRFVHETVLPQLRRLTHGTMGLNGFVIPPRWVREYDTRLIWPPKTSYTKEYVFIHLDLTSHNILLNSKTLEVTALIDWEESGYFPPELQQWKYSRNEQFDLFEDREMIRRHIALLAPEDTGS